MKAFDTTLKGLRDKNEDKHVIIENINRNNNEQNNINYYGLYDGHGGITVSKILYDYMHKFFVDKNIRSPFYNNYINKVFNKMQDYIVKKRKAYYAGSTCLISIIYKINNDIMINVINVGDSRCIICRNNIAIPLTKDHKPNWPEENKRISDIGGKIYYDGYDWRIKDLSVSRSMGDHDSYPYVVHNPDIYLYKKREDDKFMVLACDGLWDVMSNQDVANYIISNYYLNKIKPKNIAHNLAQEALNRGSTDNITIIIIILDDT